MTASAAAPASPAPRTGSAADRSPARDGHAAPRPAYDWRERLSLAFTRRLLRSAAGRAHLLLQSAEAESSGEARIFDQALARVDDPELQRMIGRHRADELRHEQLFRERLRATVETPPAVRPELQLIDRIDRALGGILEREITDDRGVLEAYCLLQALEERAVSQFPLFALVLEEVDPLSARVYRDVLEDEQRHLLYCAAVARRYARSEEERLEVLQRMREVETRAFADNQRANMDHAFQTGLVRGVAAWPWRLLRVAVGALRPLPRTRFWGRA